MWDFLKTVRKPIVLYGMGNGADKILDRLQALDIPVQGVFASDGFVRGQSFRGFPVLSLRQAEERFGEMLILLSFGTHRPDVLDAIQALSRRHQVLAPDVPVAGSALFTREFCRLHRRELETAFSLLADDRSRQVFENVVRYKLTGEISFLFACQTPRQEAFDHLLRLGPHEVYGDLGAYTGDTVLDFVAQVKTYTRILAAEPDPASFRKLLKNTAHLPRCVCRQVAVSDCSGTLPFAARGGRNSAACPGSPAVPALCLDDLFRDLSPTFLKFDLEGQELAALSGGREALRRFRPKLLLSAYHRSEDLFRLPQAVLALRPDSRLFLRHHPCLPAWDVNYYVL